MNIAKTRAEIEADIARFQKKHLRRMTKKQVKREILRCLSSKQDFTTADLAMELQTPLLAVIEAILELEHQKRIQPITDALRSGETTSPIQLNPNGKPERNQRQNRKPARSGKSLLANKLLPPRCEGDLSPRSDIEELLTLLEDRCFVFEATRMYAYHMMMSDTPPSSKSELEGALDDTAQALAELPNERQERNHLDFAQT